MLAKTGAVALSLQSGLTGKRATSLPSATKTGPIRDLRTVQSDRNVIS